MILQTPWFERKFDFSFPVGLFPVILERLRGSVCRIEIMVKDLPEEILSKKLDEDWSLKEQVGHLYDLEDLWYGRLEDFLSGEKLLRPADLTNAKTHAANHNARPIHELLQLFSQARYRLIEKAGSFDESIASRVAIHPRLKMPMRLVDSLFFVAEHDDHHIAKMRNLLKNFT